MTDKTTSPTLAVTDASFEQAVLKAEGPVLVDFWAEWCGPCHAVAPTLEEIARDYAGRLTVAKLNIDDSPESPQRFGVRAIPTLLLFQDGEVKASTIGVRSKSELVELVEQVLATREAA